MDLKDTGEKMHQSAGNTNMNSLNEVMKKLENDYHLCNADGSARTVTPDRQYCCGACTRKFKTICFLHDHLLVRHKAGGSYHYDHYLRTAFPKYDTFCRFTQTVDEDDDDLEREPPQLNVCSNSDEIGSKLNDLNQCNLVLGEVNENHHNKKKIYSDDETILQEKDLMFRGDIINLNQSCGVTEHDQNINVLCVPIKKESLEKDKVCSTVGVKNYLSDDYFDDGDTDNIEETQKKSIIKTTSNQVDKPDGNKSKAKTRSQKRKQSNPKSIKKGILSKPIGKAMKTSNNNTVNNTEAISDDSKTLVDPIPYTNCICDICGAKFSFKRGLLRHEQVKHQNMMKYNCQLCDQKFMREYNLNKHIKWMHESKHGLKRGKNNSVVKNKRKLEQTNITNKADSSALDNSKKTKTKTKNISNKIGVNSDDKKLKIKDAGEVESKKDCKKKEDKTPHTCDICGYTMPRSKMEVHQRLHSGDRPHICDICGKGLISRSKLKRHMLIHAEVKKYKCDTCGVGFQMKYKLRMHQHIHTGKKPYLCSICGAEFNHSSNLATHIRCVHLQIKPYDCYTCGRKYAKRSQLDDHILSHSTEKQFVCRYCGKRFKYQKGMQRHEKGHIENTHFPCDQCECTFSRKDNLDRHKLSHQEVMLECKLCKKTFRTEKLLQDHEYSHLGRKKFLCVVCGESYKQANQYHTHMLAAHGIDHDKATKMHEEEMQNRSSMVNSVFQESTGQVDPNLPLRLDEEPNDSEAEKIGATGVSSGICVNQVDSEMSEDNRAALNVLTRVATENLRLHCEDIPRVEDKKVQSAYEIHRHLESSCGQPTLHEEERLNVIIPPLNPMILLERNQGFSTIAGVSGLSVSSEGSHGEPSVVMVAPGSQSSSSIQISQTNQVTNRVAHHSINQPISGQHESNTRLSQDGRSSFNSLQMPYSRDNGVLTSRSVATTYNVQEARLTLENLARQHDSVSVPLTLIRLSENTMDPAGQRQSAESQDRTNGQPALGYRIQNMY